MECSLLAGFFIMFFYGNLSLETGDAPRDQVITAQVIALDTGDSIRAQILGSIHKSFLHESHF